MIGRSIGWLTCGWFIDWLVDGADRRSFRWLINWLLGRITDLPVGRLGG